MSIMVRCPSCLREELWRGAEREVRVPGGSRRPEGPAALAAWTTIEGVLDDPGHTLVGACAACGQPLVAEGAVERRRYALELPRGELVVDGGGVRGPEGAMTADEARAWVEAQLPPPPRADAGTLAFTGLGAAMVAAGVVVWVAGMAFVVWFIVNGVQTGQLFAR